MQVLGSGDPVMEQRVPAAPAAALALPPRTDTAACLLQGPGAKTQMGGIQAEIPSCVSSVLRLQSPKIHGLLVPVVWGRWQGEEQGSVPTCTVWWAGDAPALSNSPKDTFHPHPEARSALFPPLLCPWLFSQPDLFIICILFFLLGPWFPVRAQEGRSRSSPG